MPIRPTPGPIPVRRSVAPYFVTLPSHNAQVGLFFDERQSNQLRTAQRRPSLLQRECGSRRQVITMHIAERDEAIQREAARAAGDHADILAVVVEKLRAGLGRLIGVDQQSAQALRRLAAPMDSRDDFLTQVAPLRVT